MEAQRRRKEPLLEPQQSQPPIPLKTLVGARTQFFHSAWRGIGGERFALNGAVPIWRSRAAKRALISLGREKRGFRGGDAEEAACEHMIQEELRTGVVEEAREQDVLLSHNVFLIPKKGGRWRKILDCRRLNWALKTKHFKMDDATTVERLVQQGDFSTSIDLSQAYFLFPVHPSLAPYLGFYFKGRPYRFRALPFGYVDAPRFFTRAMRKVVTEIRERWGVRCVAYLDDVLILHQDAEALQVITQEVSAFMESLGLLINREKSDMKPSQRFQFLGWSWDTINMTVETPKDKKKELLKDLRRWTARSTKAKMTTCRKLAEFVGKLGARRFQVREASMYLTRSRELLNDAVALHGWRGRVQLLPSMLRELRWWRKRLTLNKPRQLCPFIAPKIVLTTDASPIGIGATLQYGTTTLIFTRPIPSRLHTQTSNWKELFAIHQAILHFRKHLEQLKATQLLLRSDNSTCVFDIRKWRGAPNLLPQLRKLHSLLEEMGLVVKTSHIAGLKNTTADALSRLERSGDYSIRQEVLDLLCTVMEIKPTLDPFSSLSNHKCQRFWTRSPEEKASGTDGMTAQWSGELMTLLHPPIPLILPALKKTREEKAQALLLLPDWRGQAWEPMIQEMAVREIHLGPAEEILIPGEAMTAAGMSLPPGGYRAVLVNGDRQQEKTGGELWPRRPGSQRNASNCC